MLILSAYGAPALQHRWFFTHPKQQAIFQSCEGRKLQEMIPGNKRRPPVRNPFLKNELPKCSTAESLRNKKRAPKRVRFFNSTNVTQITRFVEANGGIERNATFDHTAGLRLNQVATHPKTLLSSAVFSIATKKLMNYRTPLRKTTLWI